MKIVFSYNDNHIFSGLAAACKYAGFDVILWKSKYKPVFDMIDEINPDILMLEPDAFNQTLINALQERKAKVVCIGNNTTNPFIKSYNPDLICLTSKIYGDIPDGFYNLKPFADIVMYGNGMENTKSASELLYISNKPNEYILKYLGVIVEPGNNIKAKFVGNEKIGLPEYLGKVDTLKTKEMIASTIVGLDFNSENSYNYAINKKICISNVDDGVSHQFHTVEDMMEKLRKFISEDKLRNKLTKQTYKVALENTSFHRLSDILEMIGYQNCDILKHVERFK